jgi:hypothetical protein
MEYAPQGLFTSLLYLIRTEQRATKIQQHHFRLGISGRRLIQLYGDYWLYGGLGYIPESEKKKGEKYFEALRQNLKATPITNELLVFNQEVTNDQRAKEILIKTGVITAGKKLSGAQRRKCRLLTLQLDAEEKEKKDKEIRICPE